MESTEFFPLQEPPNPQKNMIAATDLKTTKSD